MNSRNLYLFFTILFTAALLSGAESFIDSPKGAAYKEYWIDPKLREIMLFSESPQKLDSIINIEGGESKFEMGRLCFALGLYRQAEKYFQETPDSELGRLFLAQINMILSEYDLALAYLKKVPKSSSSGLPLLCINQIEAIRPDLTKDMTHKNEYSKYYENFIEIESSVKDLELVAGLYTIQFGAFADENHAQRLSDKVSKEGLRVTINKKKKDGQVLHLVHGGAFRTREQAENRADQLSGAFVYNIVEIKGE